MPKTPSKPVTFRPRSRAMVRPIFSSINSRSAPDVSARAIASLSPNQVFVVLGQTIKLKPQSLATEVVD
ncbi:MAG: hypothetical protein F6K16_36585 [Symploca sp. SIO2B6]|nr:hypothetical protein [Symploca sp. SIO2B6]